MAYLRKWKRIVAIVPITRKNGRTSSLVYYDDGSHERFECRCERIVELLALHFSTTRGASQALVGGYDRKKAGSASRRLFCRSISVWCR